MNYYKFMIFYKRITIYFLIIISFFFISGCLPINDLLISTERIGLCSIKTDSYKQGFYGFYNINQNFSLYNSSKRIIENNSNSDLSIDSSIYYNNKVFNAEKIGTNLYYSINNIPFILKKQLTPSIISN